MARAQQIYRGKERLAISIDIGTETSAVHLVYLRTGDKPILIPIDRWPGQANSALAHVPSRLWFSRDGQARGGGAELGDETLTQARLFKLHLHARPSVRTTTETIEKAQIYVPGMGAVTATRRAVSTHTAVTAPPLPPGVSLLQVYAAWLHYLVKHARRRFAELVSPETWSRLFHEVVVLVVIPSTWLFAHQAFLRSALVKGGVLQSDANVDRLVFIPEAEASFHHLLVRSQLQSWLERGDRITVCDVGSAFCDVTTYACLSNHVSPSFREMHTSSSEAAGGLFATSTATRLFAQRLLGTRFAKRSFIGNLVDAFERQTKRKWSGIFDGDQLLPFTLTQEDDRRVGVVAGCLSVSGEELDDVFVDTTADIAATVREQTGPVPANIALLGGFSRSPYVRRRVQDHCLGSTGILLSTPRTSAPEAEIKAACEGAALWFLGRFVRARACRAHYGLNTSTPYNPLDPDHRRRPTLAWPDGRAYVAGKWASLAIKDVVVDEESEESASFVRQYADPTDLLATGAFTLALLRCEADDPPKWCALTSEAPYLPGVVASCTLRADLRSLRRALVRRIVGGRTFWELKFRVAVRFGGASLAARIRWCEQGQVCEGPVAIVPHAMA